MGGIGIVFIGVVVIAVLFLFVYLIPVRLWIAAYFSGVKIGMGSLIGMRLRNVNPFVIVPSMIMSHKAGLSLKSDPLEAHYLAGGDIIKVVKSLISDRKSTRLNSSHIPLSRMPSSA